MKQHIKERFINFKVPKDLKSNLVRLVIYNEKDGEFPVVAKFHSKEDYLKIDRFSLKSHYQYKYKYQVRKNGKWVTAKPYKYLYVDFQSDDNVNYRFYREDNSEYLLVCFSGNGNTPTYNYIGAFSDFKVNRLFIKDDFSKETSNQSLFYLGTSRNNEVMGYISNLISDIINELDIPLNNVITAGTSKGGFAAVLYALTYNYGSVVVGSPTLYLGNSLLLEGNLIGHARAISGGTGKKNIDWLNDTIISRVNNSLECDINIVIGLGERRYNKHLIPFMEFAKFNKNIKFSVQLENFSEHSKIAKVYPSYAKDTISAIIEQKC